MLITDAVQVFRQGKALANSSIWANSAAATAALTGLLTGVVHVAKGLGYDLSFVTDAQIDAIAGGVAALVCVVSGFLHVATNPDAGLPPKGGTTDTGSAGNDGNRDRF